MLIFRLLEKIGQDDKTYLEDVSLEIDNSGFVADDCINALYVGIFRLEQEGIPWVAESIEKAFKHDESKKQMYLKKLKEVEKIYEQLKNKISEFVKMLENNTTPYGLAEESLDLVKSLKFLKERQ